MPLDQHIEGRHGEGEARLKIPPGPMHHLLEMADQRQHRQHRFDEDAVLPLPTLAEFEIARIPLGGMEGGVAQDNHPFFKLPNQPVVYLCAAGNSSCPKSGTMLLLPPV